MLLAVVVAVLGPRSAAALPRVLVCYADPVAATAQDVAAGINPGGKLFDRVDLVDCARTTPSLQALSAYDAVLAFDDVQFADRVTLGDHLADYVDAGGGVVLTMFDFFTSAGQGWDLQGRWASDHYGCLVVGAQAQDVLKPQPRDSDSPLVKGVATLSAANVSGGGLARGATSVWDFQGGAPAVATCQPGNHLRVDLNFYPNPANWKGDGFVLLQNALLAVAAGTSPLQVTPSPAHAPDTGVGTVSGDFALTFTNASRDPLTATGLAISGQNAGEFAVERQPAWPLVVAPGGSFQVDLQFAPAALGLRTAKVEATLKAGQQGPLPPAQVALQGVGVVGALSVTPSPVALGGTLLGVPVRRDITVANKGMGKVRIDGATLANPAFSLVAAPVFPLLLGSGGSFPMTLEFLPRQAGLAQDSLAFATDDIKQPVLHIAVSGYAGPPAIALDASTFAFGSVNLTARSPLQTLTVTNAGFSDLPLGPVTVGGTDPADFLVELGGLPRVLPAFGSAPIGLTFAPTGLGNRAALLTIASGDPDRPSSTVKLLGTGTSATLMVAPGTIDLGSQRVGATSVARSLTISTMGNGDLKVAAVDLSGPGAASFLLTGGSLPPLAIPPGGTSTVGLACRPDATGPLSATATVVTDVGTQAVALSCLGVAPRLLVDPNQVDFGRVPERRASAPVSVTLENRGTDDLHLLALGIGGASPNDFSSPDLPSPPPTLRPGEALSFQVIFTPSAAAAESATIELATDDPLLPAAHVDLLGTGVSAGFSIAAPDFGPVLLGTTAEPLPVVLTNTGALPVEVTGVAVTGPSAAAFHLDPAGLPGQGGTPPARLTPGQTLRLQVTFTPAGVGPVSAPLTVATTGLGGLSSRLQGSGFAPMLALAVPGGGDRVNFGVLEVGQVAPPVEVQIRNNGSATVQIDHLATSRDEFMVDSTKTLLALAPRATTSVFLSYAPTLQQVDLGSFRVYLRGLSTPVASLALEGSAAPTGVGRGLGCAISVGEPRSPSSGAAALAILVCLTALVFRRRTKEVR